MSIFDENFKVNTGSKSFLKIEADQPVKLRIVGPAFVCMSAWDENNEVHRWPMGVSKAGVWKDPAKVEVNLPVFIYGEDDVKVWSITQKGVQKTLHELDKDPEFDLSDIDLKVSKTGSGLGTEWTVRPTPVPSNLSAAQALLIKNTEPNWNQYLSGGDPFAIVDDLPFE